LDRLRAMEVFAAVVEEGTFAAAARRLGMSPPAATRSIGQLEDHLGCRLLHRTTRSLHLSAAGELYLADARRILAELDVAERQAAGIYAEPQGLVTLTAPVMFGRIVIAPMLSELLDRYPGLSFSALFLDRVTHLMDEGIDVALRIAALGDSTLAASRVGSVRRVLCAAPSYLERFGRPQSPDDLAGHRLINLASAARGGVWAFRRDGMLKSYRPNARLMLNTADTAIAAAEAGQGITRVLSYMVASQVKTERLEILLPDFEPPAVPVQVVHKEAGYTSARVRAVVDYLVESLRGHPALKAAELV